MSTYTILYDESSNNIFLNDFLKRTNFFKIKNLTAINSINEKLIIIIPHHVKNFNSQSFIKKIKRCPSAEIIIFCSKNFINKLQFENYKIINYPISINKFIHRVNLINQEKEYSYLDLSIKLNQLKNRDNQKISSLTDTEEKILKILFDQKKVLRSELEKKVLNFVEGIESKSLDSHLARIRKKFQIINSKTNISSVGSKHVVLDNLSY